MLNGATETPWFVRFTEFIKNIWFLATVIFTLVGALIAGALWLNSVNTGVGSLREEVAGLRKMVETMSSTAVPPRLAAVEEKIGKLETKMDREIEKREDLTKELSDLKTQFVEFRAEMREGVNWIKNDLSLRK